MIQFFHRSRFSAVGAWLESINYYRVVVLLTCSFVAFLQADAQWKLPGGVTIQEPRGQGRFPGSTRPQQPGRQKVDVNSVCPKFVEWQQQLKNEYPGTDFDHLPASKGAQMAIPLFSEPLFSKFFGTPYEQLDESSRRAMLMEKVRPCVTSPQYSSQLIFASAALQPAWYPNGAGAISSSRLPTELQALRQARALIAGSQGELSSLPATAESYDRVKEIEKKTEPAFALVWPSERKGFSDEVQTQMSRFAIPALDAKVTSLLAQSNGYDGALALHRVPQTYSDLWNSVGPEQRDKFQTTINQRFHSILISLLAEQHSRMISVTSGPQTLGQGAEWYQQFNSRFAGALGGGDETNAIAQEFRKRRDAQLTAAIPEIRRHIQNATTADATDAVLAQCCSLSGDRDNPGISALQSLASQRSALLTAREVQQSRAKEKEEALGTQYAQGGKSIKPASHASHEEASGQASTSSDGGPSKSEIYDALQAKIDSYNQQQQEIAQKCANINRNSEPDPILGMQCLQKMLVPGDQTVKITGLELLSCAKAVGKPGYICDYILSLSMNVQMPPSLSAIFNSGHTAEARFVRLDNGWIILTD